MSVIVRRFSTPWRPISRTRTGLIIQQGATFDEVVTLNTTLNITNATMKVKDIRATDSEALEKANTFASWHVGNGKLVLNNSGAEQKLITFNVSHTETAALDFGGAQALYDLLVTFADGTVERVLEGPVELSARITD